MKRILILTIITVQFACAYSQASIKDTTVNVKAVIQKQKALQDSLRVEALFDHALYPVIKSSRYSGVIPVSNPTEIPDPKLNYKLLVEVTTPIRDSLAAQKINDGFAEVGRLINLHAASGIPVNKLNVVTVVHAGALKGLYTNEVYHNKYGCNNPNLPLIKELLAHGVKFIACGQAMNFVNIKKEELIPEVRISITAQTVLSNYQLKGFVLYKVSE